MKNEKEKDGPEMNPQALKIEDLPVEETEQDDVKGGGVWYLRNSNSAG